MAQGHKIMARRTSIFLLLACVVATFLALARLPSASAQAAPSVLQEAQEDAQDAANTAADAFSEVSGITGSAAQEGVEDTTDALEFDADEAAEEDLEGDKEELFKEARQKAEEGAEKVESAASNGAEEAKSAASHGPEKAKSAAGEGARKGHKLCKWSWAQRRCTPADLCQYKYQFLDAIPSESCRLKVFSQERKVFRNPDVEVKPAYALAGAAGLFAADLVAIYSTDWLQRFPVMFNAVQGFILFVSGDTLFQVLEQGWKEAVGLKWWRAVRSGLVGALNNGFVHYLYYKWIDRNFPYHKFSEKRWGPPDGAKSKLAIGFTKWAIEWPTVGLYKITSMYILTAVMSGSMDTLVARMKDSLLLTQLRGLQVWPIYDMILYAYVPTAQRPLFNTFMSILWGGYLSHVSQPHEAEEGDMPEVTA